MIRGKKIRRIPEFQKHTQSVNLKPETKKHLKQKTPETKNTRNKENLEPKKYGE